MSDEIYVGLRNAVASGVLHPNERLVEADLVERFGSSRSAVRTALVRLEQEGLVEREPNRGAKVRLVEAGEAIEIYEARMALEGLAARKAATNATARDHRELRRLLAVIKSHLDAEQFDRASNANADLHEAVLVMSKQSTVRRLVSGLNVHLIRFQFRTLMQPNRPGLSFKEHSAIVDAIVAGDPDAAEAAMRVHLSIVTATLREPIPGRVY